MFHCFELSRRWHFPSFCPEPGGQPGRRLPDLGVAGDDYDGGVGEVDADEQLDGRSQAVRARSSVGENPEEPGLEHIFNPPLIKLPF